MSTLRVLHVTNAYPSPERPAYGVFIKEQIESLDPRLICSSLLIVGQRGGLAGYLVHVNDVRRAAARADLVHGHHMLCGWLAVLAGVRSKLIVSFTSDGALNYKGRPAWLGRVLFHLMSRLSAFNIYKSSVPARYAAKSALLPNGVDMDLFSPRDRSIAHRKLRLDPDRIYVLFVSAVSLERPEKRFDFFRTVMAELERRHPGKFAALTMCNVPRSQVPDYFRAAHVHLLTSDVEGSPNSVKEALACGTPVVSRDVGNVAAMVDGVEGCGVFCGDNAVEVATQVEQAAGSDPERVREEFLRKGLGSMQVATSLQAIYRRVHDR